MGKILKNTYVHVNVPIYYCAQGSISGEYKWNYQGNTSCGEDKKFIQKYFSINTHSYIAFDFEINTLIWNPKKTDIRFYSMVVYTRLEISLQKLYMCVWLNCMYPNPYSFFTLFLSLNHTPIGLLLQLLHTYIYVYISVPVIVGREGLKKSSCYWI